MVPQTKILYLFLATLDMQACYEYSINSIGCNKVYKIFYKLHKSKLVDYLLYYKVLIKYL